MNKYKNPVLLFSGGKDSLACLYLLRSQLNYIKVVWVNTGKNFPEALKVIEEAKKLCPTWVELNVDRDLQWKAKGLPTDVLGYSNSAIGQKITNLNSLKLQFSGDCCYDNILIPAVNFAESVDCNLIITGQRVDETYKGLTRHGQVFQGLTFHHPVEDWTKLEVLSYLEKVMPEVPEHFYINHSSLDCYDCTAYLGETADLQINIRSKYPAIHQEFLANLQLIKDAVMEPINLIDSHLQRK